MFKLKSKLVIVVVLISGITAFMSCGKQSIQEAPETKDLILQDKKITLNEFIQSVETEEEQSFFANHQVVDNRDVAIKAMKSQKLLENESEETFKFRWGGYRCVRIFGMCYIFKKSKNEPNASVIISDGKYIIMPYTDDNGITSDGYFPIFEDFYIDEDITLKAGVYTANYDNELKKFTAVAIDIK